MDDYSGDIPFLDTETVPGKPIAIVPYQLDTNDMKMWTDPAYTPRNWLQYAIDSFDQVYAEGLAGNPRMMSLGLHLRIIGRPGRIAMRQNSTSPSWAIRLVGLTPPRCLKSRTRCI